MHSSLPTYKEVGSLCVSTSQKGGFLVERTMINMENKNKLRKEKIISPRDCYDQKSLDHKVMRTNIAIPIGPMGGHKAHRAIKVEVVYLAGRNPI